jgi:hypothetical protein
MKPPVVGVKLSRLGLAWGSGTRGIKVSPSSARTIAGYIQRCSSVLMSLLGEREKGRRLGSVYGADLTA